MYPIVRREKLADKIYLMDVKAPRVAQYCEPGQFVIVKIDEEGERIPLTICDYDREAGTITIVFQTVGASTERMAYLQEGDAFQDFVGPLGCASDLIDEDIEELKKKKILFVAGGVGTAPVYPQVKWLHEHGVDCDVIMGSKTKDLLILVDQMKEVATNLYVTTDDGSYGFHGMGTNQLQELWDAGKRYDHCVAIGPMIMMKFCCLLTKKYGIPTDVSLNTIMVDGTGMCGACRISVGGKTRFVCVDGPEFDGHQVDFDEMLKRMGAFKKEETEEMQRFAQASGSTSENTDCQAEKACAADASQMDTTTSLSELTDRNAPWRQEIRKAMKPKERTAIPRVVMPELDPVYRATTRTEEVNIGLSAEQAMTEARRCLDCANPTCMQGCPVSINIPSFIKNIERGEFLNAARVLKSTSALPAVCGRVCPQEKQCESQCIHLKMNEPAVAIGYLERFAADFERESGMTSVPECAPANGIKVAVIGSGPAGLSFAGDMAKYGYDVTVFEALHEIGGVLKYGIPEFRLPNKIVDVEIQNLEKIGVKFEKDCLVGKTISVQELEDEGFKGIFVGSGAGLPNFMGIPGENSINIMSSNEYLTRVNLMDASNPDTDTPIHLAKNVMVVGGGNTAMDSCRTTKRLGAERVMIVYRRSEAEMPARLEEVKHAKEEGIEFLTLHNPLEYIADEKGAVKQVVLQKMQLGEPDASGRRSPEPIPGATETLDIDMAIVAVGVSPNPIVPTSIQGLELGRKNTIVVNEGMQTNIPCIFAGGDIVRGGATVILAMGDGRKAASSMHEYLQK